jgi:hypothetical protein
MCPSVLGLEFNDLDHSAMMPFWFQTFTIFKPFAKFIDYFLEGKLNMGFLSKPYCHYNEKSSIAQLASFLMIFSQFI